jgi:putative nucleotidyltransferase with HDIG domain
MLHQTKVLLDQAASLNLTGDWHKAVSLCEQAFTTSVRAKDVPSLIEAVLRIGLCYHDMGDEDTSIDQLLLAYELANLHGDNGRAARALNAIAIHHYTHGELDAAESIYRKARGLALQAQEMLTAGDVESNLGILANIRGDLSTALSQYESALELYEGAGDRYRIARALNNIGMLHTDLKQLDAAEGCLDRALTISKEIGDVVTEAIVMSNRTELLLEQGELKAARESCDEAFEVASRLGDIALKSESLRFYGIIFRRTGKLHLAESYLRQAIGLAAEKTLPLPEAETSRELALVLRLQGRNREALVMLNRAHALFSHLRAEHDQADIDERVNQLEEDFLSLVQMWGESIEAKDRYTGGHCERVANYACRIALEVGIPQSEIIWFRMGAFLHDVGKMEIPEEILNKPGRLTDEEREVIEQHTVVGYEMLSSIDFPWDILPMVRSHHERWDGRGYPDGLKAEAIPLTARILRIADIFDALTTTRSYRSPLTAEQAFQIMESDSGSNDPDLFEIFKGLLPELSMLSKNTDDTR